MSGIQMYVVDRRLSEWGRWYAKELDEMCGGAPKQSAFCVNRSGHSDAPYTASEAVDAEVQDTDKAVKELIDFDKQLYKIVKGKYASSEKDEVVARANNLSMRRFHEKIKLAKVWLARAFAHP